MDRLSAFAARESETMPTEERSKKEQESLARLLEGLSISSDVPSDSQENGEDEASESDPDAEPTKGAKSKAIPEDIKLFEIFHEQVMSLVKQQRLQVWDTMALLVSLTNLAL
jgi:vacuolar protein sorting-associated protein 35